MDHVVQMSGLFTTGQHTPFGYHRREKITSPRGGRGGGEEEDDEEVVEVAAHVESLWYLLDMDGS